MRFSQAWIVASKDFATFTKKKNIIYTTIIIPILIAFLIPGVVYYAENRARSTGGGMSPAEMLVVLPAFIFLYLVLSGFIPTTIASYSLVGEKVENSLEPLLATPTTDGEILFGKGIAAFLPPIFSILGSGALFMALVDVVTQPKLGYNYFPNWNAALVLFIMVPLATVMSVEWNVLVSSRVGDVRIAQQLGALMILPFAGVYLAGELNIISLGATSNLLIITAGIALVDLVMVFVVRGTFRREEILTKWK
jgi:ABC-2 type transport system permease protein